MERNTSNFTSVVALVLPALHSIPRANVQSSTTTGEFGVFQSPSFSSRVACAIVLCLALAGIIADPTMSHAQSPIQATSENAIKSDVHAAENRIAYPTDENEPIEQKAASSAGDSWGPVPTKKASIANLAPFFLPFLNNGPVFGMPGTDAGDFRDRTQLSGDWGGLRTDLARHGFFFDLYTTSAYQDVASGGLKTGNTSIQNTQLSINVDTGRAGLWPGGIFHVSLESRYGSSSPQNTFTAGSSVPQYTGLAFPGPYFVHDVLPTEYFLLQSLTPKFAVILGKANVLIHADQTFFGNDYKYYFANLNFNKNPIALNFYNTSSLAAIACTSMTLLMYAERKQWPLRGVQVRLVHSKIHAEDCAACDTKQGTLDQIDAEISLIGDLSEDQRQRLMEIADRCPIHRTLISEMQIRTTLAVADAATG